MSAALVTGGLRRMGAAIALRLAAAGYDLVLQTRGLAPPPPDLMASLAGTGRRVDVVALDLDAVEVLGGPLDRLFGERPDIALVVNNASRFEFDDFATATAQGALDHFRVNALAPLLIMQAFARGVGHGAVVNILDAKLEWPHADFLSYTLGKAALKTLTELGARHYAPAIRVNGVAPGLTLISPYQDEGKFARERAKMPLGGGLGPADVAEAVAYLAAAGQVTGEIIHVDGGERFLGRTTDPSR